MSRLGRALSRALPGVRSGRPLDELGRGPLSLLVALALAAGSMAFAQDDAGAGALRLDREKLELYLRHHPTMQRFMAERGLELEAAAAGGDGASLTALYDDFESRTSVPLEQFLAMHAAVSSAFAEALAARSRDEQRRSLESTVQELREQLARPGLPAESRAELETELADLEAEIQELSQPMPPAPGITEETRAAVRSRLAEIEKAFTADVLGEGGAESEKPGE